MRSVKVIDGKLQVSDAPVPAPAAGEVLVRVQVTGINFADLNAKEGTPGSEIAGRVEKVGNGVTGFQPGDVVAGFGARGAYAQYAVVPADLIFKVPSGVEPKTAGAAMMQGMTAYHCLVTAGRVQKGDRVLIFAGSGGVGGFAIQWAKQLGAASVIAVTSSHEKMDHAQRLGADQAITYEDVKKLGENAVDLILDSVGGQAFSDGLSVLATFGRIVIFGQAGGPRAEINPGQLIPRYHTITGSAVSVIRRHPDRFRSSGDLFLSKLKEGAFKVPIWKEYPLEEANQAWVDMRSRRTTGKLLLVP